MSNTARPALVSDFDFALPPELIAQRPLPERSASRMMVLERKTGSMRHGRFADFPDHLRRGEVLVLNDTRVIPARLWGTKDGREVEFLFIKEVEPETWDVLCRPARRIKPGDFVVFPRGFEAEVTASAEEGRRTLRFKHKGTAELMAAAGFAPLPPYIKRGKKLAHLRDEDLRRYQTVFAKAPGSIAAPTAGLHFTREMLTELEARGIEVERVTLSVGLATFQPVRAKKLDDHRMLEETYIIHPDAARVINAAKRDSRPVAAVGTTSVRALESAAEAPGGPVRSGPGSTSLFIRPGYEFKVVDKLLTNFHLPRSTLLMLVAALAGLDLIKAAYAEAVRERYRFFSYGDCMLIE
jgi:S-adenosylmethionine:tRNA ribosyltransferase-isomerase